MSRLKSLLCVSLSLLCMLFSLCTADEEITKEPVAESYIDAAKEILHDKLVVNATAMQGTVNKTLLPEGCPVMYHLKWNDDNTLNVQIKDFCVGNMPLTITFSINAKFMQLNTWEKDEYTGDGWIKFQGKAGKTSYIGNTNEYEDGTGGSGTIQGYLNVNTHEIEFVTNFNVLNFSADTYKQKIDPTRVDRYDEEFAQYEKDLEEYKKENGIE